jgi:aspartyl-tRNA(Asn)/glutamyl-tRNA(Gln) amidotransferase subunit B
VISGRIAKDLLAMLLGDDDGASPRALVEARGLRQVTDVGAIERAVDAVVAANAEKAEQARAKPGMLGWFVGQVMKATGGKANPQAVSDALKQRLSL